MLKLLLRNDLFLEREELVFFPEHDIRSRLTNLLGNYLTGELFDFRVLALMIPCGELKQRRQGLLLLDCVGLACKLSFPLRGEHLGSLGLMTWREKFKGG